MYESPIDCFVTQLNIKRREFEEKQILEAVQGVGVNVDKHELEKALRYDRGQYKKGYADGAKEVAERIKNSAYESEVVAFIGKVYTISETAIKNAIKETAGES